MTQAKVYYNLHRKCLSVQVGGIVRAHAQSVILENVTFKVSAAGRARVLKQKRKNVHAFICGDLIEASGQRYFDTGETKVTYNPYKYSSFVRKDYGEKIFAAKRVLISGQNIYILES